MANVNSPFGLRPVRRRDGAPWNGVFTKRLIQNAFATSVYRGDLIVYNTSGYMTRFANGGAIADGVFWGCNYLDSVSGTRVWSPYYPASVAATGDIEMDVIEDPNLLFEIQADNTTPTIAIIGANTDITATAGSTANGLSAEVAAIGSVNTTATFPLRIVGFSAEPDNDTASPYARLLVQLNTTGSRVALGI